MIHIGMDPDLFSFGGFVFSWHGFLSFVAVSMAVYLVARWAPREKIHPDVVYSTAVWAIVGGIVGARLVHVIDQWEFYGENPGQIVALWNGGIAIYGAILGGLAGGVAYAYIQKCPIGKLADLAAPAILLAQAFGRIGDIINGEHVGKLTTMPWGFVWSNLKSPTFQKYGLASTHPAVVYEMLWDILAFFILWKYLRGRLKPDGMLFAAYLAIYSFGRFFISFFREDRLWLAGMSQAQIIALLVMAVTIPLLMYKARFVVREEAGARAGQPGAQGPKPKRAR
ncbi:MAG: prolipoprotein diacylglyceryl transferase [Chloroflexi bacterium]|nr:prolipoprotein diacylglyceryl transferase [Chloroflexota bacterium]